MTQRMLYVFKPNSFSKVSFFLLNASPQHIRKNDTQSPIALSASNLVICLLQPWAGAQFSPERHTRATTLGSTLRIYLLGFTHAGGTCCSTALSKELLMWLLWMLMMMMNQSWMVGWSLRKMCCCYWADNPGL